MEGEECKTILLVEDESIIAKIAVKAIMKFGYKVVTANSGEGAVELALSEQTINLILMDIDLGDGIDGTEAARLILARRNIPIVFHTSHSEREMVDKVKGITRYGYVIKSSGDFVLNSSIEMAFELFEATRNLENSMLTMIESEEKYRAAFMTSPDSISITTIDGRFVDVNEGFTTLTGFTKKDIDGILSSDINIWPDLDNKIKTINPLTETGSFKNYEFLLKCKDGSYRTVLTSARIIRIKNIPHVLSITKDISDRKKYEEEIEERNRRLIATNRELERKEEALKNEQFFTDSLLDSLPGIFYLYSYPELRLKRWNKNHETLLGFGPGEIKDRELLKWHIPEAKDSVLQSVEWIMKNGSDMIESPLLTKDGGTIPFLLSGIKFESGGHSYLMGMGIDITERKRVENEKTKFLDIIERSLNEIYIFDSSTLRFRYANSGALLNLGYTMEEMNLLTPADIKTDLTSETFDEIINSLRTGEKEREVFYTVNKRKDGSRYPVEVFMQMITTENEEFFLAVINDITDRKRIEDALTESEERYRTLAHILPDGVVIHADGKIVYANHAAHNIIHAEYPGQLIGFPVINFVHPDYRDLALKRMTDGVAGRIRGEMVEEVFITFDGAAIQVNVTAIPFTYSGKPAMLVVFNDITELKHDQEQIKNLLGEKEILLREVHHRIKNNMSTIKSLLSLQSYSLDDPAAESALHDAESRIDSMMVLYDKLYRSDNFTELSLQRYLPTLIDEIATNFGTKEFIKIEKNIEDFNVNTKTLFPIGIIVNELITNSMKYAFSGRDSGLITISASMKNNHAVVIIADNGIGIPESIDIEHSEGFGLSLVSMLTGQIHGTIRIERGNGTKFILEFDV